MNFTSQTIACLKPWRSSNIPVSADRCSNMRMSFRVPVAAFWLAVIVAHACAGENSDGTHGDSQRPNIVWIVVDDMSANFSCYGETLIQTPHVDRLAKEGTLFRNAFVTAPVCSPSRSAMITGMYQTSIHAHHHRSGRGVQKIHLPEKVSLVPGLLQRAGYFTCIGDGRRPSDQDLAKGRRVNHELGKTDYNFEWDPKIYNSRDWTDCPRGKPFFMQVQLAGGKLRGNTESSVAKLTARAVEEFGSAVNPEDVILPSYYPRDDVLLRDWGAYLDAVRFTDQAVGQILSRLETENLLKNTLIVFMTDHGISHARGKQFLYDEGTRIPFIVSGPGIPHGVVRKDLIEHIDIAAISLAAAGVEIPTHMHSRNVFANDYEPRDAVFAARDRCDETVDRIRSVRTDRFLYIRNFLPQRPLLQPNAYKDGKSILRTLRQLHDAGKLDPIAERVLFQPSRPEEELYEWTCDSWQLNDLAQNPSYRNTLHMLRDRLDDWMEATRDPGPESDAMYDSDMAVYIGQGNATVEQNIALMKRWKKEGK
jgi:arylsulfatase A-like enzyme